MAGLGHSERRRLRGASGLREAGGEQRQALASAVVAYATQLVDPGAPCFAPVLRRIAHKHVSLGIRSEQYTIVTCPCAAWRVR